MLRPGNSKLGPLIHQWSIPSGLKKICIGASKLCLSVCYAMRNHYLRPAVKKSMERNFVQTESASFTRDMVAWVQGQYARVVRIHASGEFYNAAYVRKWVRIVKKNPEVVFFAYTRSWRDPDILEALKVLAELPNMRLWFSCDIETGAPPRIHNVRRAYLMKSQADPPTFFVDLVFRHNHRKPMKWAGGALVCPYENGVSGKVTCSRCQMCFKTENIKRQKLEPVMVELSLS